MRRKSHSAISASTPPLNGYVVNGAVRSWTWVGESQVAEGDEVLARVGPYLVAQGEVRFEHDALGSVVAQRQLVPPPPPPALPLPPVTSTAQYGTWGALSGGTQLTSNGYTGHQWEEPLALNQMQQRWQDPVFGVFLSRDSVGAGGYLNSPNGMGPWSYANLSPARNADPDGRRAPTPDEAERLLWLRALAQQKEKTAGIGGRIEAFLATNSLSGAPRDARALRKYAERWEAAIDDAPPEVAVLVRSSDELGNSQKFGAGASRDGHVLMTDAEGNEFFLDTAASFETEPGFDEKSRDLATIQGLQTGPDNLFLKLAESLGGKGPGGKSMKARSPGLPKNLLKGTRAWRRGTKGASPSELARWNVKRATRAPGPGDVKPKYAPEVDKWMAKGGRVGIGEDGTWTYTDWEGNSVPYVGDYPDFKRAGFVRQSIDIKMKGNYTTDFTDADAAAPRGPLLPENTWHHHQNMRTMQEVDWQIHARFTHSGGVKLKKAGQ